MFESRGGSIGFVFIAFLPVAAFAELSSQQPSSILVFPKVVVSESEDTFIQLTNTADSPAFAWCFYLDQLRDLSSPFGPTWERSDFTLELEQKQPLGWRVSSGGGPARPVPGEFDGQLTCIQVDENRAPLSGNQLIGTATIVDRESGDRSKYSAIGLQGNGANDGNSRLCLGGDVSTTCPAGAEYDACPSSWMFDFRTVDSPSGFVGAGATVDGELTLAACTLDTRMATSPNVSIGFIVLNEYAQAFSFGISLELWRSSSLRELASTLLTYDVMGTDRGQLRFESLGSDPNVGLTAVFREFHEIGEVTTSSMVNGYAIGARSGGMGDLWVLPECDPALPYCL